MAKTLYLIDGHGFIFRAFYAVKTNLTREDGTPVGAAYGFCNMLLRVLDQANDNLIGVVFDPAGGNFRHDLYPEYKANRSEPPEELVPQFSIIREAVEAFGITALEKEGFEADDLIATYAQKARERGLEVRIISSDKDLMQLIRDGVRLVDPINFAEIGPEQVMDKFGVAPEKVVDVQSLAGDSTDNIPGVPGIGVKTAAELINTYGSLEDLLARTAEIKQPKRRETLETNADKARLSRLLVTLKQDAPMPKDFEELRPHTPDLVQLIPFLKKQNFKSLITRVEKKWSSNLDVIPAQAGIQNEPELDSRVRGNDEEVGRSYELVTTEKELDKWIDMIRKAAIVSFDTETNHLTPARADLVGISLSTAPGNGCYIPVGHRKSTDLFGAAEQNDFTQLDKKLVIEKLKPVLEDPAILKIAQNVKYDWEMLAKEGVHVAPFDDTMVMSYVLDGGLHGHGLDELSELHLGEKLISYKEVAGTGKNQKTFDDIHPDQVRDYAAEDADMALRLYRVLSPRLLAEKRMSVYHEIDKPCVRLLAEMELNGITVDPKVLQGLSATFAEKIAALEKQIHEQAGTEFNIGSPKQLGDILFNNLNLPQNKTTKTGAFSTDAKTLEELSNLGHTIVDDILMWRQLSKLKSTYTDALQEQINPTTGRVHTSFNLAIANTGRLSSTDPNLQNIPIRTEEGRLIRTAFVAAPGHKLVSIDYSQIELRLVAEMAGIKRLQQAFRDGMDIHAITASEIFGIPLTEMTPERRRDAKAINFGIIYGISGFGLAKQIGTDTGTASAYIKQYMQRFPELAEFMERNRAFAKQNGFVETLYGRKIFTPGITSKNGAERGFAERQAINAPIQGTAADIMKLAMIEADRTIKDKGLPAKILLQVHDELVLEVAENALEETAKAVKTAMESVADLNAPLVAEWGAGSNWDEAH